MLVLSLAARLSHDRLQPVDQLRRARRPIEARRQPLVDFGKPFPAIKFWTVPELATAWGHLTGAGATTWIDWQVLLYTAGRALLWVVVVSATFSMYSYFRAFFTSKVRREKARDAAPAPARVQ
jgi:hypothetical protein